MPKDKTTCESSTVMPVAQGAHFFSCVAHCADVTTNCLAQFSMMLSNMDVDTVKFYYEHGDIQKWIKKTVGENEFTKRLNHIGAELSGAYIKQQLLNIIQTCVIQLKKHS